MKTRLMILFGSALLISFSLVMFFWSKAEAQESSSEEREAVEEESVPQEMEPPLGAFDLLEPEETLLQEEEAEERPDSDLSAEQDEAEEDEEIEEESVDSESEEAEEFEIVGEEESSEDVSELSTSGAAGLEVESEKSET